MSTLRALPSRWSSWPWSSRRGCGCSPATRLQDARRPLPAHRRPLRGQRRPGARRVRRQGRDDHPVRHRRGRPDGVRRGSQPAQGRPGRDHRAVDRRATGTSRSPPPTPAATSWRTAPRWRPRTPRCRWSSTRSTRASTTSTSPSGPEGANRNGALTDLLEVTAENFGGQGEQFHETIANFSQLSQTLDDNKEELFGSAAQLEEFVSTLAQNDSRCGRSTSRSPTSRRCSTVRRRSSRRRCSNLSIALGEVTTFVKDNKASLSRNIKGINRVAKVLVKQRAALEETLDQRTGRPQQPGADLQPAGRHARHQRQPRPPGAVRSPPTRRCCCARSSELDDPSGALCDAIDRSCRGPGSSPGHGLLVRRAFDLTLGGLVEVDR